MKDFIFEGDKNQCYGCRACENRCPTGCITIAENQEGFLFPKIDQEKCTECGLCFKVCPAVEENLSGIFHEPSSNVYAAWNNNLNERLNSSSGGIFPALAKNVLKNNGVVYGCSWKDETMEAHHIRISSALDIHKLQGSKYVQSSTDDTFKRVENELNVGLKVLYTGTPCQIAGLTLFLGKDYDNLTTVDLICHGTPGNGVLSRYVTYLEEKHGKITDLKFRDKKKSGYSAYISFTTAGKRKIMELIGLSPYMVGYYKGLYNRESCYLCDFTTTKRVSDITISDFWGLNLFHPELTKENKFGVSCILCNTEKGISVIHSIKENLVTVESNLKYCSANQPSLLSPQKRPDYRNKIFKEIEEKGFKCLATGILRPRHFILYKIIPDRLRKMLRSLKK